MPSDLAGGEAAWGLPWLGLAQCAPAWAASSEERGGRHPAPLWEGGWNAHHLASQWKSKTANIFKKGFDYIRNEGFLLGPDGCTRPTGYSEGWGQMMDKRMSGPRTRKRQASREGLRAGARHPTLWEAETGTPPPQDGRHLSMGHMDGGDHYGDRTPSERRECGLALLESNKEDLKPPYSRFSGAFLLSVPGCQGASGRLLGLGCELLRAGGGLTAL